MRDQDSVTDLELPIGYLLVRAAEAVSRAFGARLRRVNLTARELQLLRYLDAAGPLSQKELADGVGVAAPNLVAVLDGLEGARLLKREIDLGDRRRRHVSLTALGRRALARRAKGRRGG